MKKDHELVDYFIGETNKKFDIITVDLKDIQHDIQSLKISRGRWVAMISVISALVSVFIEAAFIYWGKV